MSVIVACFFCQHEVGLKQFLPQLAQDNYIIMFMLYLKFVFHEELQ